MKPTRTLIVVVDGRNVRFLENDGPGKGLFQLRDTAQNIDKPEGVDSQQGRAFNSVEKARHKLEPHHTKSNPTGNFAGDLVKKISQSYSDDQFDRLILCAAPDMLAQLRQRIDVSLSSVVIAEIPKDLTHVPTGDLPSHFEHVLAV